MVFSSPIQYVIVGYLRYLSIFGTLVSVGSTAQTSAVSMTIYSILLALFIIWPIGISFWLTMNHDRLNEPTFFDKWKGMYNGMRTASFQSILYYAVFSVRRFDLVLDNLVFN